MGAGAVDIDRARAARGRCWLYDPTGTVAAGDGPAGDGRAGDGPAGDGPAGDGLVPLRWSPVTAAEQWDGALLLARAIVGAAQPAVGMTDGSHWTERAEALLAPLLHAAAIGGRDLATVLSWVNRHDGRTAARLLGAGTAADLLEGILATEKREQSSIWSTASGVLAAYRADAALASASAPNFDPRAFVASGDTVYVCAAGRHQGLVAPLVAGLIEDVRAAAFERASARLTGDASRAAPSPWAGAEPPLLLALDEVANIAPLPDLPSLVSEGGGQGVLTLACFQDLSQARRRWGPAADGFGSLFGATLVLPGIGDVRTLEALSVLCGSEDVWVRSESADARRRSRTWSMRRQRRLDAAQVARGVPGHALLVGGGRAPAWAPLTPWWQVPGWGPAAAWGPSPGWGPAAGWGPSAAWRPAVGPGPPGAPDRPARQGPSIGWGGR
ncbi:MAG TPA: TraM recognition domain-containing protein [Acidimicrobiales bacterium]|nr:TraM recognition domain-containing protein [Acidimicrobiales bacterium]